MPDYIAILRDRLKHLKPNTLVSESMRKASVLAIFLDKNGVPHLLFTLRAKGIGYHSDQVSFPGGAIEKGETALRAALRETHEEIGVESSWLEIIGRFHDDSVPVSGYIITPYAAVLKKEPVLRLQKSEVVEAFTVPFEFFMDESNYKPGRVMIMDSEFSIQGYNYDNRFIWGLTCRFIRSLVDIIRSVTV